MDTREENRSSQPGPARVLWIDGSNLGHGGGVTHLIQLLQHADPPRWQFERVVVWSSARVLSQLPECSWLEKRSSGHLDSGLPRRVFWQHRRLPELIGESDCDVLLSPGGTVPRKLPVPTVTMFRNSLPFEPDERRRYPALSRARARLTILRRLQRRSMERADGVIFLSDYARGLGLRSFQPVRHETIPHGVAPRFEEPPRTQRPLDGCSEDDPLRFLYVSHVDMYKHQWSIVEAFGTLRREGLPLALDLVGHVGNRRAGRLLQQALDRWDPAGRHISHLGAVGFERLDAVYRAADAFVFGSSCENLPNTLLEAMAAGLPVASSRAGPMPEVLGDAGLYFDPTDPGSVAEAVRRLAVDPDLRASLARQSFARASNYSWRSCADQTLSFLERSARASGA